MSQTCPKCRAIIEDSSYVCEYCGNSITIKQESMPGSDIPVQHSDLTKDLKEALELITKMETIAAPTYNMIGFETATVEKAEKLAKTITVFAGDNKKALEIVVELRKGIEKVKSRLVKAKKTGIVKLILLSILYFIAVEGLIAVLIWLGHTVSADSMQTWIVGSIALLGIIIGLIAAAIVGAIVGGIGGGLFGFLIIWLLSSLGGNIILAIIWNAIFIPLYFLKFKDKMQ